MFNHIMVPVDLRTDAPIEKTIAVASQLGQQMNAKITLVSVTGSVFTNAPHMSKDATEALAKLAADLSRETGLTVEPHNIFSPDVPAEVDSSLMHAVDSIGADLVVMGSHVPGLIDYVFSSHAGWLASHAKVSVFVVR
jgi:nucleotide-binding universal stress UspA family protein